MVRRLIKALLPPIVPALWGKLRKPEIGFTGDYASWEAALTDSTGYDAGQILARVATATRRVVAGEAVFERDSVLFDQIEYSWPMLASLLHVALRRRSLRVADFGGSLGSTWRQNSRYLSSTGVPTTWNIVEQENFVALGKAEFADKQLNFYRTIHEACADGVDVVLFSSSLCYVADPTSFLQQARAVGAPYLIIDRLPMVPGQDDRVVLQTVTEPIYPASYPVRLFAQETFAERYLDGWRVIEKWLCDLQPDSESQCYGFYLERQ